jgi:hypothetical protein
VHRTAGIVSVLAVLASGYWLGSDPGPEQLLAVVTTLGAHFALDRHSSGIGRRDDQDHDLQMYNRIRELFTTDTLYFLREFDFGNSFKATSLDGVTRFFHEFDDTVHEFLDRKLEKKRLALHASAKELVMGVALNTFPTDMDLSRQRVSREWKEEDRRAASRMLNEAASKVLQAHDDLTRTAKKRLPIRAANYSLQPTSFADGPAASSKTDE